MAVGDRDVLERDNRHEWHLGRCARESRPGTASPRSSALRAPTPLTVRSALERRRLQPRHLAQRRVVEDDVRRHAARARDLQPHGAQPLEQLAIDVLPRLGLDARPRARRILSGPAAGAPASGRGSSLRPSAARALRRQREHRIGVVGLLQQPQPDQLLDVAADFGDRRTPASRPNVLSCSCPRATHLLAGLAAQHAGDVRGAEPLADAGDARQDLARERPRASPERLRARRGRSRTRRSRRLRRSDRRSTRRGDDGGSRRSSRSAPSAAASVRVASVSSPFRSSITRHFMKSAVEEMSTHSASRPSRPARPDSC